MWEVRPGEDQGRGHPNRLGRCRQGPQLEKKRVYIEFKRWNEQNLGTKYSGVIEWGAGAVERPHGSQKRPVTDTERGSPVRSTKSITKRGLTC